MFKIPSLLVVREEVNKDETLKEFSIKDIEKWEVIGRGSFGTTFIAKFDGKEVALKQPHTRNDEVAKFLNEAKVMSCIVHENVVGFEAVFDFNVFGTDRKLSTPEDLLCYCDSFMFQNIETILPSAGTDNVKGLKYHLHSKELVQCNLKPANVLISNHHYRNLVTKKERNKVFQDKPIICRL